jgi:uncharacterized protein YndB with AHSA1/START domain
MNASATRDAYGTLIEPATLKMQRLLPGPIERIWAYLTESDKRRKWLAAGKMELKVGAPFELVWRNDELTDPPGERPAASIELEAKGNEVLLTLIHRRLPNRSTMLGVSTGWHVHLDLLVARARGEEPPPFWDGFAKLRKEYDRRLPPA